MSLPVTTYSEIRALITELDVLKYAKTRNYLHGAVSRLSPYLSRGVITLPEVSSMILARYTTAQAYGFIFELAWREYFQRVWTQLGDGIYQDIKSPQSQVAHRLMPEAVVSAQTGISAIDAGIATLYHTGYMHNHLRMYIASICCNVGRAHWLAPSRWMYYHLLDHDIASNTLSWQWVAGSFSSKKYYCNQENINKYCGTSDTGTYLDTTYEKLVSMPSPQALMPTLDSIWTTKLPVTATPVINPELPILIYHSYHLSPTWMSDIPANRILLLEPSHFDKYPVSSQVLSFIISLAANISDLQIYCGEISELLHLAPHADVYTRQHPTVAHYPGIKTDTPWLFPEVKIAKGSFMSFWKQCEKHL
jgi:deoxyribodipyrimidine photo-lyase